MCAAQALNVSAFDLVAEIVGIHDGATLESGNDALDSDRSGVRVHADFSEGRDISELFIAATQSETAPRRRLPIFPTELLCCRVEDGAEPFVLEIFHTEIKRIHL